MTNENIFEHQREEWDKEQQRERKESDKAHDSGEGNEIIENTLKHNCDKCGRYFFINSPLLNNPEQEEDFKCGYKVVKVDGKYLCTECLVNLLWENGLRSITLKEIKCQ